MSLAPPAPSPLVPGYRLDRYELLCPIADGGMAQVWVARIQGKHGFEKLVAIKSILPKYASDPQFQQMFLDEARIASGIEHTNVARIYDLGDERGVLYLAMEWVDGDALTKLHRALEKKNETIPTGMLLRVIADTCGGLHAAHELRGKDGKHLGVVHRDVSPQNILVSSQGVAKLIDFGIAKALDRHAGETNTGILKGKVHYMAPEQALGGPLDRRADVWAIGAILHHLISGKPPYDAEHQLATLHALASGKPPHPLPPGVPPPVAAVIQRALAHDREKRYATAAELQVAIEAAMVSAQLSTTTGQVAEFIAAQLSERAARRQDAIDIALAAAGERARVQELLKPLGPDSSISDVGVAAQRAAARGERPSLPTMRLSGPLSPEEKLPAPPSVPTQALVGVESSVGALPVRSHRNTIVVAVGVVGIALGIGGTVLLRGGGSSASQAAAVAASVAVVPAPPAASLTAPPPAAETAAASVQGQQPAPAPSAAPPARTGQAVRATSGPRSQPSPSPTTPRKIPKVIDNGF